LGILPKMYSGQGNFPQSCSHLENTSNNSPYQYASQINLPSFSAGSAKQANIFKKIAWFCLIVVGVAVSTLLILNSQSKKLGGKTLTSLKFATDECSLTNVNAMAQCCSDSNYPVLGGIDVVAFKYLEAGQPPVMGSIEFPSAILTENGVRYIFFFHNDQNRAEFLEDPWAFVPKMGGFDAWEIAESSTLKGNSAKPRLGPSVDVCKWFLSPDGHLVFFGTDENQDQFENGDWPHFLNEGNRRWQNWFPDEEKETNLNTRCLTGTEFDSLADLQGLYDDFSYMETVKSGPNAVLQKTLSVVKKDGQVIAKTSGIDLASKFSTSAELSDKERRKGDPTGMLVYVHYGELKIERVYLEESGTGFWNEVMLDNINEGSSPKDVVLLPDEGLFYYSDLTGKIVRCPLLDLETAHPVDCNLVVGGMGKPGMMRIAGGKLFFSGLRCADCLEDYVIWRTDAHKIGTPEIIVDMPGQCMGLTVDEGFLYFTDNVNNTLSRLPLTANTETEPEILISSLNLPKQIEILEGKVYWTDDDATTVRYASLEDMEPHLLISGLEIAADMIVRNGAVFWSDKNGYIVRGDLATLLQSNGTEYNPDKTDVFTTVVDGLYKPKGLDVVFWPAPAGLDITASTKYTERGDPPVYNDYKWCPGPIVQPYMETVLKVNEVREGHSYEWEWNDQVFQGPDLTVNMKEVGMYPIILRETDDSTNLITRERRSGIIVKYVRREIRNLLDEDREAFLDALEIMVKLPEEEGKEKYGPEYHSIDYFVALHNDRAGARDCDHMHNGMGFFSQHNGLTLVFDQGLQVINPAVITPYWDFTIDGHEIYSVYGGDFEGLWNSKMFQPDWFGQMDPDTHTVTEGRWAWALKVPGNLWDSGHAHNSYGLMRAPWSNNNFEYIQRFRTLGGIPVWNVHEGWPTCESHYFALTNYKSWLQFSLKVASQPHGSVHAILGGTTANEKSYDLLEDLLDAEDVFTLRAHSYNSPKNLWRRGLSECPEKCEIDTPPEECRCTCGEDLMEKLEDPELFDAYFEAASAGSKKLTGTYDLATQKKMIQIICEAGTYSGDQLESASPADVIFWPMHPTVERLAMWRLIRAGFTDWDWPEDPTENYRGNILLSAEKAGDMSCEGHGPNDVMIWKLNLDDGDNIKKQYTTFEFLQRSDPTAGYQLPYVYDVFEWDHCMEEVFDFDVDLTDISFK